VEEEHTIQVMEEAAALAEAERETAAHYGLEELVLLDKAMQEAVEV
jgi:hypothetical protein